MIRKLIPPTIIERIKCGESIISDLIPSVSIMFVDIKGFTQLTSQLPIHVLVYELNKIFIEIDTLLKNIQKSFSSEKTSINVLQDINLSVNKVTPCQITARLISQHNSRQTIVQCYLLI